MFSTIKLSTLRFKKRTISNSIKSKQSSKRITCKQTSSTSVNKSSLKSEKSNHIARSKSRRRTTNSLHQDDDNTAVVKHPLRRYYPSEKKFTRALELFNGQMQLDAKFSGTGYLQLWKCQGKLKASFQLCVLCRDVGKMRSYTDSYYLNVIEERKSRTILCKGCLASVLWRSVGNSFC